MKKFLLFVFLSMLLLSGCNQNMEEVSSGETLENSVAHRPAEGVEPFRTIQSKGRNRFVHREDDRLIHVAFNSPARAKPSSRQPAFSGS